MGIVRNFFIKLSAKKLPINEAGDVVDGTIGAVYTVSRLLGSSSVFSLLSGSNTNLSIGDVTGVISVTDAIAVGSSQTAIVREVDGLLAAERPVVLTGQPSPLPVITNMTSYSQFARTQRYRRATASDAGTWSLGSGGDADKFTIDSTTGVWQLTPTALSSLATIASDRVLSLPLVFTRTSDGLVTNKTLSITVTPIEETAVLSEAYQLPMTLTAGTKLTDLPGWSVTYPGATTPVISPEFNGTKLIGKDNGANAKCAILLTPSLPKGGSTIEYVIETNLDGGYPWINLGFAGVDHNNSIVLPLLCYPNGTLQFEGIHRYVNGTKSGVEGPGTDSVSPRADGSTLVRGTYSSDGSKLTISVIGLSGSTSKVVTWTVDVSAATYGSGYGFHGGGTNGLMDPNSVIRSLNYSNKKTNLSLGTIPASSSSITADYSISWLGVKPTRFQHRFVDSQNVALTEWLTGESVVNGSTSSGTATYRASAPGKITGFIQIRSYNDTGSSTTAKSTTSFLV